MQNIETFTPIGKEKTGPPVHRKRKDPLSLLKGRRI
jgi:hypothetical protein